jgi:hypothetical protein
MQAIVRLSRTGIIYHYQWRLRHTGHCTGNCIYLSAKTLNSNTIIAIVSVSAQIAGHLFSDAPDCSRFSKPIY